MRGGTTGGAGLVLFHLTRRDRLGAIMREGLVPGPRLFSGDSVGDNEHIVGAEAVAYGRRPVYLSVEPWFSSYDYDLLLEYGRPADFVLLAVVAAGLELLADVPRLVEQLDVHRVGDALVRDGPTPLDRWFADGRLMIAALRDKALAEAAMAVTDTCATLSRVEPRRISVVAAPPRRRRRAP